MTAVAAACARNWHSILYSATVTGRMLGAACSVTIPDAYRCCQHIDLTLQFITQRWLAIEFRPRLRSWNAQDSCWLNLRSMRVVLCDTADE